MWCNGQVYLDAAGACIAFKPGQLAIERRRPCNEGVVSVPRRLRQQRCLVRHECSRKEVILREPLAKRVRR